MTTSRFTAVTLSLLLLLGIWAPATAAQTPTEPADLPALTQKHGDLLRLYWAFFERGPEPGGALYWMERQERCDSLVAIADLFATSEEFAARYGSAVDNDSFVEIVYRNVLGRAADEPGLAYWSDLLDTGKLTRGGVMLYVSLSTEFRLDHPYPSDGRPDRDCSLPSGRPTARRTHDVTNQVVATAGAVTLRAPIALAELGGFHQSNHDGAQQMTPGAAGPPTFTMDNRGRGTASRTALDFAANPLYPVQSPVDGTVLRAGTYVLYCRYTDEFVVIAPDDNPAMEVKLLHLVGVSVARGDRVATGQQLATQARTLPFKSQIDEHTAAPSWPHVHVEVVDPSIPGRPSGGC